MDSIRLLFTRPTNRWQALPITAWEGDDASHVGILLERIDIVVDASMADGVRSKNRADWMSGRVLVDSVQITPKSIGHLEQAEAFALDSIGQGYDWLELLGFPLLRDLGNNERYVCSTLARAVAEIATGYVHPGRRGRYGVRLCRLQWAAYAAGAVA